MKQFVEDYYNYIFVVFLASIIVLSFLLGKQFGGVENQKETIVFSCSEDVLSSQKIPFSSEVAGASTERIVSTDTIIEETTQKGIYVGSKNGTKYYTPGCSGTNRIKPENYIWFESVEDATLQGYTKGSC
jgi:hypothetical protein